MARQTKILAVFIFWYVAYLLYAQTKTIQYQYDNLNRLTRVDYNNGTVIQYSYDAVGNRTSHVVTASNAPAVVSDLSLSRSGNSTVLTWSSTGNATSYKLYRGIQPYFTPGTPYATVPTPGYTDANVLGNPEKNYYYVVTAVNSVGESAPSNRVGKFEFRLVTTSLTDFNEIALPLKISGVNSASGLMTAIPNCNSVAKWNAGTQGYDQYIPAIPSTNFAVQIGYPYYVNMTANTVLTLLGEYATSSFNLVTTSSTDFNEIMLPLDRSDVTTASQLMAAIPNCNSVAKWNAQTQGYDQYIQAVPVTNFAVLVGYPYYVNMTANVVWPSGFALAKVDSSVSSFKKGKGLQTTSSKAPHAVYGQLKSIVDSLTVKRELYFTAYILSRENEKITNTSPGCSLSDGWWVVQCANFPSIWQAGEVLHVDFMNRGGMIIGYSECVLTYGAADHAEGIVLSATIQTPVSERFGLYQNYPNPFNPKTTIRYQLARNAKVTLMVFSLLGQKVKVLVDEEKPVGYYSVMWDGTDESGRRAGSGIYMVQMNCNEFSQVRKLLLLR